ncbi:GAF and ANTAR domain-containing protein [Nocardia sp. NPDC051570]|uniref:GAF and ANTAR domain-containing protein n=1 Tax=Nocardia sp. NPDC051570 TaxID=3364324 RepID=UPI00378A5BD7
MTDRMATGMTRLTALLLSDSDIVERPDDIAGIVSGMLPGGPLVGVTLDSESGVVGKSGGTHELSAAEVHHYGAPGPYRVVLETAQPMSVPDLRAEERWDGYARRMLSRGIRSHDIWPLVFDHDSVGTLSVYLTRTGGVASDTRDELGLIVDHLSVLLHIAAEISHRLAMTEQLRAALDSRSIIDQALGIIMGQRRCDHETAFDLLREQSNRNNVKVATLAARVVASFGGAEYREAHFNEPPRRPKFPR